MTGEPIYWVELERSYVRDPKLNYRIRHMHGACALCVCVCLCVGGMCFGFWCVCMIVWIAVLTPEEMRHTRAADDEGFLVSTLWQSLSAAPF